MSIGTKLSFVLSIWLQNTLGGFPDFIFDIFPYFRWKLHYKQNSFNTNAPGWCLMKCLNYNRFGKCSSTSQISSQESWQDFRQEFQDLSTVQDNSRSYQEFQEVTGICGKIQDLGKSFKIFYTGLIARLVVLVRSL